MPLMATLRGAGLLISLSTALALGCGDAPIRVPTIPTLPAQASAPTADRTPELSSPSPTSIPGTPPRTPTASAAIRMPTTEQQCRDREAGWNEVRLRGDLPASTKLNIAAIRESRRLMVTLTGAGFEPGSVTSLYLGPASPAGPGNTSGRVTTSTSGTFEVALEFDQGSDDQFCLMAMARSSTRNLAFAILLVPAGARTPP